MNVSFLCTLNRTVNWNKQKVSQAQPGSRRPHIMCLRWNEGQSPIYNNEPLAAWSRGACAVRRGLLQPQTGRPVTKHCTAAAAAHGLTTTTTAPGHWHARSTRPAWQNTTRTHPGGEEKTPQWVTDVWLRGGGVFAVLYCAPPPTVIFWRGRRCFPFLCGPLSGYFPPSELSYSGRPVEGAASRAARQLCGCFFFFSPLFFFSFSRSLSLSLTPLLLLLLLYLGKSSGKSGHIYCSQTGSANVRPAANPVDSGHILDPSLLFDPAAVLAEARLI